MHLCRWQKRRILRGVSGRVTSCVRETGNTFVCQITKRVTSKILARVIDTKYRLIQRRPYTWHQVYQGLRSHFGYTSVHNSCSSVNWHRYHLAITVAAKYSLSLVAFSLLNIHQDSWLSANFAISIHVDKSLTAVKSTPPKDVGWRIFLDFVWFKN